MAGIRITGGKFKGRRINAPQGGSARFSSAKVREAIFDLVGPADGLMVLDLFAGSGSFTIEALSRGAASLTAVESDRRTAALLRRNLASIGADRDCQVLNMDVRYALPMLYRQGRRYDLIFADPPYDMGHIAATLDLLMRHPVYRDSSLIVFEHSKREETGLQEKPDLAVRVRRYGDTHLSIFSPGR